MTDRRSIERWVDGLFGAWREGDPGRATALFAADAEYRSHPFRKQMTGRDEIFDYWAAAVAGQENRDIRVGSPVVDGTRAAVEWWASLRESGVDSMSTGSLFLIFDGDGQCRSLREVWTEQPGRQAPYTGWGT